MPDWINWDNRRATPYLHWSERLDSTGTATAADANDLWRPKINQLPPRLDLGNIDMQSILAGIAPPYTLPADLLPPVPDVAPIAVPDDIEVLVAVADTDLPLGHRGFRRADGSSRVLYHWQMDYAGALNSPKDDGRTPPGRTFWQDRIDELLKDTSGGDLLGTLDAQAFNTAIGALDLRNPRGHHGLLGRYAHGAHVLDTAGGADPWQERDFARKVGLITIGMPPRWDFGEAGEILDILMFLATFQIFRVSRALWRKANPTGPVDGGLFGFPTVINLAFGRQAGSKRDDGSWFPVLWKKLSDQASRRSTRTPPTDPAPFELVMPAGNDNMGRVAARLTIPGQGRATLHWRIRPGDQSDNYLEIWAEDARAPDAKEARLKIGVTPPGAAQMPAVAGPLGKYRDLISAGDSRFAARLYRDREPEKTDTKAQNRPGYVLATGPSDPRAAMLAPAPSGIWSVKLDNDGTDAIVVEISVQTDQSVLPVAGNSGRAYLDDCAYEVHDDAGRRIDAVRWDGQAWQRSEPETGAMRHGSINAAASTSLAAIMGGYRLSDGHPASYSATGAGLFDDEQRSAPTTALPTDDSAVLGGILGAGAGDSTRVAMRGTSFAAAQATRIVAQAWLDADGGLDSAQDILVFAGLAAEDERPPHYPPLKLSDREQGPEFAKFGHGRARAPRQGYPARRG